MSSMENANLGAIHMESERPTNIKILQPKSSFISRSYDDATDRIRALSTEGDINDSSFINHTFKDADKGNGNIYCDKSGDVTVDIDKHVSDTAHDSGYHTGYNTPPETRDFKNRLRHSSRHGSVDLFGRQIRRNNSNVTEYSTESYTERFLRSGAWPLAEGSDRVNSTTSIEESSQNTPQKLTNNNLCDPKDELDDKSESTEETKNSFSLKSLSREQIIILIATSFTNLLSFLSLSVLAPFFPLEADKKGVNSTLSGWIFGVFALVQFLTSPLFGRIMPVVGCRFMYICGLFTCGGCTLLFGILDKVDTSESIVIFVVLCFLTRVLLSLGCTGLSNAGFVLLVTYFPDSIATVFGIGEVFTGIGMVTGPALGGFLYGAGGFILPFAVIGGCSFAALPIIWYFIPVQEDTKKEDESLSIGKLLLYPRAIVNSIVIIVAASVWSVLDPTLEPHLRVYGLGPELVGVLFLIMAAFYSVTSPIWGRIADKLPDNRSLLIPGLLLCAVGLLLVGPSPVLGFRISFNELWLTIISLIVLGTGSSMAVIPTYDVYIDILGEIGYPEDTRTYGMVSGLWVSMYALGDFAGPSLGGFLLDEIGFEWLTTWVAAACVVTSILVAVTWFIEKKCCSKSKKITEKTPLLASGSNSDVLNTYPPGLTYSSYQAA